MIVIADSGSSKTDWLILEKNEEVSTHQSDGINPFFQDSNEIYKNLAPVFDSISTNQVSAVYFYGAGCIKGQTDHIVSDALKRIFAHAGIYVEDDMLGGARALLGTQPGIACILGTGANSCLYNGKEITDKVPTLGFILGDEGSGAHLGKLFLNDYFKRAIPEDLKKIADNKLQLDMAEVLTAVYRGEYPSRYLAGFSKFLNENKNHPYTRGLIKRSFSEFFSKNVERYPDFQQVSVNFVGSIAFHYSGILQEVASERGISIGRIMEKPLKGLKEYHIPG